MDNKKDELTQNNVLNEVINPAFYSFFKDNLHFIFCYRKSTKLLKAIYVITDNLRDEESLTMRQLARDIVKDTVSYFTESGDSHKSFLQRDILLITALFEAFSSVGLISPMNASIIASEYYGILSTVEEMGGYNKTTISAPKLAESMFELSEIPSPSSQKSFSRDILGDRSYKGHKGQDIADFSKGMSFRTINKDSSKNALKFSSKSIKDKPYVRSGNSESEREMVIIKEIKLKGSVTVKDIATLIKGVSEKTVQRELVSLLSRGVLKREGERRWSRYLLV